MTDVARTWDRIRVHANPWNGIQVAHSADAVRESYAALAGRRYVRGVDWLLSRNPHATSDLLHDCARVTDTTVTLLGHPNCDSACVDTILERSAGGSISRIGCDLTPAQWADLERLCPYADLGEIQLGDLAALIADITLHSTSRPPWGETRDIADLNTTETHYLAFRRDLTRHERETVYRNLNGLHDGKQAVRLWCATATIPPEDLGEYITDVDHILLAAEKYSRERHDTVLGRLESIPPRFVPHLYTTSFAATRHRQLLVAAVNSPNSGTPAHVAAKVTTPDTDQLLSTLADRVAWPEQLEQLTECQLETFEALAYSWEGTLGALLDVACALTDQPRDTLATAPAQR